jgi:hypothetical protein
VIDLRPSDNLKASLVGYGIVIGLVLLSFVAGCLHGKSGQKPVGSAIDSAKFFEGWHRDTVDQTFVAKDSGEFKITGKKQGDGKVKFTGPVETKHGVTNVDATYDPASETLSGRILGFIEVRVPQIILTHTTSTVIPYKVFVPRDSEVSGWTWVGIGAAFGSILTVLAFAVLHFHL